MKRIHFIGVCGVGMSAIAVMMKKNGWKVTGSDKGFFPPVSEFLKKNKIDFYPGWNSKKMGKPNVVVVGNFISLNNPEYLAAKEKKINIRSYPEILAEYLIKKNSLVVVGTFGKTTITAFLAHIFKIARLKPSWFIGGLAKNFSCGAEIGKGDWSIVEGDEYTTARWDKRSKFLLYKPTHLVLTSIIWDHFDVFPQEKKYDQAFKKLIKLIPLKGVIVAAKRKSDQKIDKIISKARAKIIRYGEKEIINNPADYAYKIISLRENGSTFVIYHQNKKLGLFKTSLLGEHLVENLCAGIAFAHHCGISLKIISQAVKSFQGVKRRLEIREYPSTGKTRIKVIDDLAHSPSKAKGSLMALRAHFPKAKIFAVYEPNVGNRTLSSRKFYKNAFQQADTVIIPRLSKTKTNETQEKRMEGKELARIIQQKNKGTKVLYLEDDDQLVKFLVRKTKPQDIIVFLGSHGFRGMIEQTLICLHQSPQI